MLNLLGGKKFHWLLGGLWVINSEGSWIRDAKVES